MNGCRNVLTNSLIFLGSILIFTSVQSSTAWAQPDLANLQMVRLLENQDVLTAFDEVPSLDEGVAFLPGVNIVVKLDPPPRADRGAESADVGLLSANAEIAATIAIPDPINTAFNSTDRANVFRLFFYDATTSELIGIKINQNFPDAGSITRFDAAALGVSNPQGMTLDGDGDTLYILDGPELVVIDIDKLESQGLKRKNAKRRDLRSVVGQHSRPRGIAFNPQNGHLSLFNPGTDEIIELTDKGKLVARRGVDVLDLDLTDLKGCIFAPSSDRTDNPSLFNLFIATGGSPSGEVTEWSLN